MSIPDRTLAEILGHLAHDLRTPLTTMSLASRMVQEAVPEINNLSQKKIDLLTLSTESISLTSKICNHILTMIQVQVSELPSNEHFITVAITDCINEALAEYPFMPKEAPLIHWHNAHPFNVRSDPILLKHVLFNLIKNALYAIRSVGKGTLRISTMSTEKNNQIIVHDTGAGITAAVLPHIFERYYTTYETKNGLGLTFCKRAMAVHAGTITCSSVENEYTKFVLNFPKN